MARARVQIDEIMDEIMAQQDEAKSFRVLRSLDLSHTDILFPAAPTTPSSTNERSAGAATSSL